MKFDHKVYKLVKKIPPGEVSTYKQIAEALDIKAYRAVGQALKRNKNPIVIPCHRIVRSTGDIGGYSSGVKKKILLLQKEGIEIKNKKIDLKEFLWKPQR